MFSILAVLVAVTTAVRDGLCIPAVSKYVTIQFVGLIALIRPSSNS